MIIFLCMLAIHFLVDFLFSPLMWLERENVNLWNKNGLIFHSALHGLLIGLFTSIFSNFFDALIYGVFIFLTHSLIDYFRTTFKKDCLKNILIDQILHIFVILLVFLHLTLIKNNTF